MKHRKSIALCGVAALLAAPAVAAAADAAAAHGAEASTNPVAFNFVPFVAALVIFGIAFGILGKVVWPKLLAGLEEREKKIRDEIFSAEQARARADEALRDYEKSLADARTEANKMIESTRAEQARMAAELKSKAEVEVNAMRESAMRGIESAKRAALSEIYSEAASLSTAVAARILEREVNEQDQERLVQQTVEGYTKDFVSV